MMLSELIYSSVDIGRIIADDEIDFPQGFFWLWIRQLLAAL